MAYEHITELVFSKVLRFVRSVVMRSVVALVIALGTIRCGTTEERSSLKVIFFGDSLTAGYGLGRDEAFPSRVREYAAREGFLFDVINAGVSGDTTAGGLRRLDWVTKERPDLFVLALGANDGLRGLDVGNMRSNLSEIVHRVQRKFSSVPILLLPMELPPTFGKEYTQRFRNVYTEVARETAVHLGPFLLEAVAGRAELNLPDGMHPNARGHELVAQTVWPALKEILVAQKVQGAAQQPLVKDNP